MLTLLATHTLGILDQPQEPAAAERQAVPHRALQFARLFNEEDSVSGGACQDNNIDCEGWAHEGECETNSGHMHVECPLSCKRCTALANATRPKRRTTARAGCHDEEGYGCAEKAQAGGCDNDKGQMLLECPKTCNVCNFMSTIQEAFGCDDKHQACKSWADSGECSKNPGFMSEQCTESCDSCEQKRQACNRPPDTPPLISPGAGDISATYKRIVRDFPQCAVLARPVARDP